MTERPYLPCREILDFLYLYLSGELPEEEMAEFERHLGVCPSCVNYIETYRQTIALGRAAFRDPEELERTGIPDELVVAIRAARQRAP
jgi:anti-sigma factor RsiW